MLLTNARLVLPDEVRSGSVQVERGLIADIAAGSSSAADAEDLDGDFLLAGAVDLHTDNLERQVEPRAGTRWPSRSALLAHDAHCAAAGITTVFDALCVGDLGFDEDRTRTCTEGVADLDVLTAAGLLKVEHLLHLRCELPAPGMVELLRPFARHRLLRMVSLMDHTPGGGQYADLPRYRAMRLRGGDTEEEIDTSLTTLLAQRARIRAPNRAALLTLIRQEARQAVLASHDDRTLADVAENIADGIPVAEFPVTLEAARAARAGGQGIIAGAPNVVRGGSHTGNVSAAALLEAGLVDALASDYVPASMIEGAFIAAARHGMTLHQAVGLITWGPARLAGLADRGAIATGLRADLVRVRVHEGVPVIRAVWRGGLRIH